MNQQQLPLEQFQSDSSLGFCQRCYGWTPRVGCLAVICNTVAYSIDDGCRRYAYCMRVIVCEIYKGYAICKTTKGWEKACAGQLSQRAGQLWHVPLHDLKPYFIGGIIQEQD